MSVKAILYLQEISSNTGKQYLILLLLIMELKYNTNLKYIILKLKYVRWFQNKDLKQTGNTRTGIKIVNLCIVLQEIVNLCIVTADVTSCGFIINCIVILNFKKKKKKKKN